MLILELYADSGPSAYGFTVPGGRNYWGHPWIWSMLHNFGQRPGLHGDLVALVTAPAAALAEPNSTCVGIGITPEGIEQNPVVYELMLGTGWSSSPSVTASAAPAAVDAWLGAYAHRRYGGRVFSADASVAWHTLRPCVYSRVKAPRGAALLSSAPSGSMSVPDPCGADASSAWLSLANASSGSLAPGAASNAPLLYDLVDFGRASAQDAFEQLYVLYLVEWGAAAAAAAPHRHQQRALAALDGLAAAMASLLQELDALLATQSSSTLGRWLHAARAAANITGADASQQDLFEFGARNQLTLWGPTAEEGPAEDYAHKHWAGLVGRYYAPRWAAFHAVARGAAAAGHASPLRPAARANLTAQLDTQGVVFCAARDAASYPTEGTGGAATLARTAALADELQQQQRNGAAFAARWRRVPHADRPQAADTLNVLGPLKPASSSSSSGFNGNFTADVGRLAYLCDAHPRCVAFNSDGWLKSNGTVSHSGPSVPCDLYVRR